MLFISDQVLDIFNINFALNARVGGDPQSGLLLVRHHVDHLHLRSDALLE